MSTKGQTDVKEQDDIKKLHAQLCKFQEAKGFFFNKDDDMTWSLLEQLVKTKQKYGYMACPCRLANGKYELDKDILCPCSYRPQDVEEYGACFCGLYVSREWHEKGGPDVYVPDRRPPEKIVL